MATLLARAGLLALERQLDSHILDRAAGRHVVFTPLGLELVERARTALTALEAVTEAATAARAPMESRVPGQADYIIGPGDTLSIFVYRLPELSTDLPVRP